MIGVYYPRSEAENAVWIKMGLINYEKFRRLQTCSDCFQSLSTPEQKGGWGMEKASGIQAFERQISSFPHKLTTAGWWKANSISWDFTSALSNQILLRISGSSYPVNDKVWTSGSPGQHPWVIHGPIQNDSPLATASRSINHSQSKQVTHLGLGDPASAFPLSAVALLVPILLSRSSHTVRLMGLRGSLSNHSLLTALVSEICTCHSLNGASRLVE